MSSFPGAVSGVAIEFRRKARRTWYVPAAEPFFAPLRPPVAPGVTYPSAPAAPREPVAWNASPGPASSIRPGRPWSWRPLRTHWFMPSSTMDGGRWRGSWGDGWPPSLRPPLGIPWLFRSPPLRSDNDAGGTTRLGCWPRSCPGRWVSHWWMDCTGGGEGPR